MSLFETADDRVSVDVWSDVMCPFCLIGDRLLDQAAARADHPVQVRYHSYQLQPDLPADRTRPVLDMLVDAKRMPREQVEEMDRQITARGAEVGVEFRQDI
ncbi:DsbA family oxidoreductase, partial [Xanthomonas citri pv. citri]|nr:DsbA family oxidoreductase [Xanthomonas citri pv. citri]